MYLDGCFEKVARYCLFVSFVLFSPLLTTLVPLPRRARRGLFWTVSRALACRCCAMYIHTYTHADDSHLELAEPHLYRGLDRTQPLRHVRRLPPQGEGRGEKTEGGTRCARGREEGWSVVVRSAVSWG